MGSEDDLYCIGDVENGIDYDKVFKLIEEYSSLTEQDCCRCWALRLCRMCFAKIIPNEDQKMDPAQKRSSCQDIRASIHQAFIRFYSVIEFDPGAFNFMEEIERAI